MNHDVELFNMALGLNFDTENQEMNWLSPSNCHEFHFIWSITSNTTRSGAGDSLYGTDVSAKDGAVRSVYPAIMTTWHW